MINLYIWRTPNGYKPLIFAEEASLDYKLHAVDIGKDEQFASDFLKISPNNKIPALVDGSQSIFESGAILMYLAQKTGLFMPADSDGYYNVLQWLMWQIGGVGPMMGQAGHFKNAAPEKIPYAQNRYLEESKRLLGVLDKQLQNNPYVAGQYSIADMAIYPWVFAASGNYIGMDLSHYKNVENWADRIGQRPAVQKAYEIGASF